MKTEQLYLKAIFCCMACDGNIAPEEIEQVKKFSTDSDLFKQIDIKEELDSYVKLINESSRNFLKTFFDELKSSSLSEQSALELLKLLVTIIESDNEIEYAEVKFFKKVRALCNLNDEQILKELPGKEDYLLPDIIEDDDFGDYESIDFTSLQIPL